jgi:hypothetical protein
MNVLGGVVSTTTSIDADVPNGRPARVADAATQYRPWARVGVIDQLPPRVAVVDPAPPTPSTISSTVDPGVAVPMKVGVASFVMSSVLDDPESEPAFRSGVDGGAVPVTVDGQAVRDRA